jgi:hypothetical protein
MKREEQKDWSASVSSTRCARIAVFSALLVVMLLFNVAAALAQVQSHRLSETRVVDTNLNMGAYQINTSRINATTGYFTGNATVSDSLYVKGGVASFNGIPIPLSVGNGSNVAGVFINASNAGLYAVVDNASVIASNFGGGIIAVNTLAGVTGQVRGTLANWDDAIPTVHGWSGVTARYKISGGNNIDAFLTNGSIAVYGSQGSGVHAGYFVGNVTITSNVTVGSNICLGGVCRNTWPAGGGGGGGVNGSGVSGRIAVWNDTDKINSSASLVWDFANSRMGIGTASPQAALDVQGGTVVGNASGSGSLVANAGVYGTGINYGVYGANDSDTYGYLGSNSYGVYGQYAFGHYGYLGGSLAGVYGKGEYNSNGFLGADNVVSNVNFGVLGNSSGTVGFYNYGVYGKADGNDRGNIGVVGSVDTSTYSYAGTYGVYGRYDADNYGYLGGNGIGVFGNSTGLAGYFIGNVNVTGNLTVGTGTVFIDGKNSRIGINTTSPEYAIDVRGGMIVSNISGGSAPIAIVGLFNSSIAGYLGGASRAGMFLNSNPSAQTMYGLSATSNGTGTGTRYGMWSNASNGNNNYGVYATSSGGANSNYGIYASAAGTTNTFSGYFIYNNSVLGYAGSNDGKGLYGRGTVYGVQGDYNSTNFGYVGSENYGVYGTSTNIGVYGFGESYGVFGTNGTTYGYLGGDGSAIYGQYNGSNYGYIGSSDTGVYGRGDTYGIYAQGGFAAGYFYSGDPSTVVYLAEAVGIGVEAQGTVYGVKGASATGYAGFFDGKVWVGGGLNVTGNITAGTGTVFIDGTNSRIGIGTTRPSDSLEVQNGGLAANNSGGASVLLAGTGVFGTGSSNGVVGMTDDNHAGYLGGGSYGVKGQNTGNAYGFLGYYNSSSSTYGGVAGYGLDYGVWGEATGGSSVGVSGKGVYVGTYGEGDYGVYAYGTTYGLFAYSEGEAGHFIGNVNVTGNVTVGGLLKLSNTDSPGTCNTVSEGSVYYDASLNEPCYCDGVGGWKQFDGGGAC